MKRFAAIATGGIALLTCALYARWSGAEPANSTLPSVPTGVKSITLPSMQPDLPPGPGRDTVVGACAFCHSGRYVLGQPPLPRKTWTAVVDKMRKTYGAP